LHSLALLYRFCLVLLFDLSLVLVVLLLLLEVAVASESPLLLLMVAVASEIGGRFSVHIHGMEIPGL
jgi:hypothetical protein